MKASLCRARETRKAERGTPIAARHDVANRSGNTGAEDGGETELQEGQRKTKAERTKKKRRRRKKKKAPDNQPIPPLAENTENRESASLLLSSSFSLPPSPTCADFQEFSVIFGPRTRFNTLPPLPLRPPLYLSPLFLDSLFIYFFHPTSPCLFNRLRPDSCQKPEDIWSPGFFPLSTRGRKKGGQARGDRDHRVDEPSIKDLHEKHEKSQQAWGRLLPEEDSTQQRRREGGREWRTTRTGPPLTGLVPAESRGSI